MIDKFSKEDYIIHISESLSSLKMEELQRIFAFVLFLKIFSKDLKERQFMQKTAKIYNSILHHLKPVLDSMRKSNEK